MTTPTTPSVCIHVVRESLLCHGLTSASPYAWDAIIACGTMVGIIALIGLVILYRVTRPAKGSRLDNDLIRCMTQAEIDKRGR